LAQPAHKWVLGNLLSTNKGNFLSSLGQSLHFGMVSNLDLKYRQERFHNYLHHNRLGRNTSNFLGVLWGDPHFGSIYCRIHNGRCL